jgi:hypothetical protein
LYTQVGFTPVYVSTHNRARLLIILLIANAILSLLSSLTFALGMLFPTTTQIEEISDPGVLVIAVVQVGSALIQVVVYIATIVVFLMWMYRSYENLPSFGVPRRDLKYSSGWAVGSFFVPFVSLVVPYRAMKELWSKSVPGPGRIFGDPSAPGFFPLWWAVWLISNMANQVLLRMELRGELSTELSSILGFVSGLLDILAAVLALMVVREIAQQQTQSANLLTQSGTGGLPPPPPTFQSSAPYQIG